MVNTVKVIGRDFNEILSSVLLYVIGSIVAGLALSTNVDLLKIFPAIIIVIPAINDVKGNIYAPLGSRLNTLLHLGLIKPSLERSKYLNENLFSMAIIVLSVHLYIGFLGSLTAYTIGLGFPLIKLLSVILISAFITFLFLTPFTILISIITFKRGLDPDNFTTPLITLVSDVSNLPILLLVLRALERVNSHHLIIVNVIALCILGLLIVKLSRDRKKHSISLKIIKENLTPCLICALIEMLPGVGLGIALDKFIKYSSILFIIPSFIGSLGALTGILSARLSTMLHIGEIEPKFTFKGKARRLIIIAYLVGFIMFLVLFIIDLFVSIIVGLDMPGIIVLFMLINFTGYFTLTLSMVISYYLSIITFMRGIDPDNVVIPILTTAVDFLGVIVLSFVMSFIV